MWFSRYSPIALCADARDLVGHEAFGAALLANLLGELAEFATDDACSAQPQGLFPIATSLRHGPSRFCLNAEHTLWAWPLGADSSIVSRIEVDMTMKIATALAVVTALSTALGVLITVLAGTLMTTYL